MQRNPLVLHHRKPAYQNSIKTTKRQRKYSVLQVPLDQADARWKCETCDNATENDESRWCMHCRMYDEDCRNGQFDDYYLGEQNNEEWCGDQILEARDDPFESYSEEW